jgi:hypothetical protein
MQAGHHAAASDDTRFSSTMGTDQSSGKALAALASIGRVVSVQEWGASAAHALANSAVSFELHERPRSSSPFLMLKKGSIDDKRESSVLSHSVCHSVVVSVETKTE